MWVISHNSVTTHLPFYGMRTVGGSGLCRVARLGARLPGGRGLPRAAATRSDDPWTDGPEFSSQLLGC